MTNNIEKLYELAGIKKKFKAYKEDGSVKYFHTLDEIIKSNIYYRPDMYCRDLDDDAEEYPPFTDTKQLNLIKYFSENIDFLELSHNGEEFEFYTSWSRTRDKDFSQALASFIYYKWKDLTPEQREEIRGILE